MTWEVTSVTDGTECRVEVDGVPFKLSAAVIAEQRERAFKQGLARFLDRRLSPYGGADELATAMFERWQRIQTQPERST